MILLCGHNQKLAAALTAVPGASAAFRGGVVAYATDLKATMLGVPPDLLEHHGAVHPDVAAAMAAVSYSAPSTSPHGSGRVLHVVPPLREIVSVPCSSCAPPAGFSKVAT